MITPLDYESPGVRGIGSPLSYNPLLHFSGHNGIVACHRRESYMWSVNNALLDEECHRFNGFIDRIGQDYWYDTDGEGGCTIVFAGSLGSGPRRFSP